MAGSWFGRASEVLAEVQETGSRLGVFTLTLAGVDDPFDPDPAWDRRYGGRAQISELLTGDSDFRLQAALDGCRNSVFERDEAGRFREANPVFTDVVMWIPAAAWRADSMRGGPRIQALQHTLSALHEEKFSRSLPESRAPRYTIMGDPDLPEDCIAFQFGFGVFVPGPEDVLEGEIGLVVPGDPNLHRMPPWLFWQDGAQTRRPVGVYKGQRSLLISGSNEGPIRPELWFRERSGHVLVNLNDADAERIYSDTSGIRVIEQRTPADQPGVIEWRLDSEASGARETLWVRIQPPSPDSASDRAAPPPTGAAPAPRAAAPTPAPAKSAVAPQPAPAPEASRATPLSNRLSLHLAGIALFKIDPARMPGLEEWTIWLDDRGWPVGENDMDGIDEPTCLALRSHRGATDIQVRLAGTSQFVPVPPLPCTILTASGSKLELLPAPVPGRYEAILMLAGSLVLPLSPSPLILGRATATNNVSEPDLPIELLSHPRSARWDPSVPHSSARLDAVELSRRHLRVCLRDGQLEVGMEKGNTPAYTLGADGAQLMELPPQSPEVVMLAPGQHLLVGGFVFRLQQEAAHPVASTGAHMVPYQPD
jgi:hypothetical protein